MKYSLYVQKKEGGKKWAFDVLPLLPNCHDLSMGRSALWNP